MGQSEVNFLLKCISINMYVFSVIVSLKISIENIAFLYENWKPNKIDVLQG